jgi:hypothetical protein
MICLKCLQFGHPVKDCQNRKSSQARYDINEALAPRGHRGESRFPKDRSENIFAYVHETPNMLELKCDLRKLGGLFGGNENFGCFVDKRDN